MNVILEFCLASLIHHQGFIRDSVPQDSSIFANSLFQDSELRSGLQPLLVTSSSSMRVTGIPPCNTLLQSIESIPAVYGTRLA